jgi:hypothetical protein
MVLVALAAVVFGLAPGTTAVSAAAPLSWSRSVHVSGVLDVAGPRSDGEIVVAAAGRLFLLDPQPGR